MCFSIGRIKVSIHAPARGATFGIGRGTIMAYVSIHAPARGATTQTYYGPNAKPVSIHAPARGATWARLVYIYGCLSFNPRAREGRDRRHNPNDSNNQVSIHAPARGATVDHLSAVTRTPFQSTRPRGARREYGERCGAWPVSIHAPARGATRMAYRLSWPISFNPRAREGRDSNSLRPSSLYLFQSTRPRGARLLI